MSLHGAVLAKRGLARTAFAHHVRKPVRSHRSSF